MTLAILGSAAQVHARFGLMRQHLFWVSLFHDMLFHCFLTQKKPKRYLNKKKPRRSQLNQARLHFNVSLLKFIVFLLRGPRAAKPKAKTANGDRKKIVRHHKNCGS